MRTLNLGILAHVDAGKTSLTERLLFHAGVIRTLGGVDTGDTQTDTLQLERERGITIRSAVASFSADGTRINLLDTPGHPDFIAEVERVLGVLDGAVLVVSAVEGVQAQTRVLMRALVRLKVPTIIFLNKIDRRGADDETALVNLRSRLTEAIVPMGRVIAPGTPEAAYHAGTWADRDFRSTVLQALAERDDDLLAAFADDRDMPAETLRHRLAEQTAKGLICPVFSGSAITGAGIAELMTGIAAFLPATAPATDAPASAAVFKVERNGAGEKVALARVFSGAIRVRDRIAVAGKDRDRDRDRDNRITDIEVFAEGRVERRDVVEAGDIARIRGLADIRVGDWIGERSAAPQRQFAPPMLESVIVPSDPAAAPLLWKALSQLAEQDPLINLRHGNDQHGISVSLYGEVQKEVIEHALKADYGLDVRFLETSPIYVERIIGTGSAVEHAPDPFLATIGLSVEPAESDGRHLLRSEIDPGVGAAIRLQGHRRCARGRIQAGHLRLAGDQRRGFPHRGDPIAEMDDQHACRPSQPCAAGAGNSHADCRDRGLRTGRPDHHRHACRSIASRAKPADAPRRVARSARVAGGDGGAFRHHRCDQRTHGTACPAVLDERARHHGDGILRLSRGQRPSAGAAAIRAEPVLTKRISRAAEGSTAGVTPARAQTRPSSSRQAHRPAPCRPIDSGLA
jgi:ribosomal protection tetracycline resistance protein